MDTEDKPKKDRRGGVRKGAGRPKKADEIKLIERLDNIIGQEEALQKLKELVLKGNIKALTLYLAYRYGKPTEFKTISIDTVQPIFEIDYTEIED